METKILIILISILSLDGCNNIKEHTVAVGQVWKETCHQDDPYQKADIHYKKVIEITGDYVLYIQDDKDTLHEKKYWFVVCSEIIVKH